ncbi:MAG: histidine phosphatase family protein [Ruminococcus sp.]|nr:histidine phosphatase family protein [Ruminococcus sp.]
MILTFIRHGKTRANEERRYLGKTDEPLSEKGIRDLLSYKEQGIYPKIDALFVSPMKRCLQTAEILYPQLPAQIIPEWEEIDFGRFEYKNYEMLKNDAAYQAWIDSNGTLPFPEGESREAFLIRCEKGFRRMCERLCLPRQDALTGPQAKERAAGLIVHGGTIMALLSLYGGKEYFAYQVRPGDGYQCRMCVLKSEGQMEKVSLKEIQALQEDG